MTERAVFLDRDGTLIEEVGYPARPEQIRILAGAAKAMARLAEAGYRLIVVTNQSGIARGYFTEDDLERFHGALDSQLDTLGAAVDAYYVCPHHPDPAVAQRADLAVDCECRKPKPGLILRAAEDFGLDLASSWMVGDTWRDVQAGQAAGVKTIKLPASDSLDDVRPARIADPTAEAARLATAADIILAAAHGDFLPEEMSEETPRLADRSGVVAERHTDEVCVNPPERPEPTPPVSVPTAVSEAARDLAPSHGPRPVEARPDETAPRLTDTRADTPAPTPEPRLRREGLDAHLAETSGRDEHTCARCGQPVPAEDVESGAAGRRNGLLLCRECLGAQPPDAGGAPADSSAAMLREAVTELRRLTRARQGPGLTMLRLFAYVLQAAALLAFFCGIVLELDTEARQAFVVLAFFLQLLVLTLLVFERKP